MRARDLVKQRQPDAKNAATPSRRQPVRFGLSHIDNQLQDRTAGGRHIQDADTSCFDPPGNPFGSRDDQSVTPTRDMGLIIGDQPTPECQQMQRQSRFSSTRRADNQRGG